MLLLKAHRSAIAQVALFPSSASFVLLVVSLWAFVGCTTRSRPVAPVHDRFVFHRDTFAFTNELRWVYSTDPMTGQQSWAKRPEKPAYSLRCFVLCQRARQFWWHAEFDPTLPRNVEAKERQLVRSVIRRSDFRDSAETPRVKIPGYSSLREFSSARSQLLQEECGDAWRSYLQRGHWRMVFPFNRSGQQRTAELLEARLSQGVPCAVHVVRFPSLKINHALLLFDLTHQGDSIVFHAYDPNTPSVPIELLYHPDAKSFELPTTQYFVGGFVNVYEVYRGWIY